MKTKSFLCDNVYNNCKNRIKDKDCSCLDTIKFTLNKMLCMFSYENLPTSIPHRELENYLLTNGHCGFIHEKGHLFCVTGAFSGLPDVYNNPTEYNVNNVCLGINKTYTIDDDIVIIKNDFYNTGVLPILEKYSYLLCETELTINTVAILSRITTLISASDDRTKQSADLYIDKVLNGDFCVVAENGFFDGIKLQNSQVTNNQLSQLIELIQYYKASLLNDIGLNANYNMKRETLNSSEVELNNDGLIPFIQEMLEERLIGIEKVNNMFGTDIKVNLNSVWNTKQDEIVSNDNVEFSKSNAILKKDEDTETDEDIETDEDTETNKDTETDEDIETDEDTETNKDTETDEDIETDEDTETNKDTETDEDIETDEDTETNEDTETDEDKKS